MSDLEGIVCKCCKVDYSIDPCGHGDTSDGCPMHDPKVQQEAFNWLVDCGFDWDYSESPNKLTVFRLVDDNYDGGFAGFMEDYA